MQGILDPPQYLKTGIFMPPDLVGYSPLNCTWSGVKYVFAVQIDADFHTKGQWSGV